MWLSAVLLLLGIGFILPPPVKTDKHPGKVTKVKIDIRNIK